MDFPALHLSQAVLVSGKSAKLTVQQGKNAEIVIALMNENNNMRAITTYVNMTQQLSINVVGKGAEVHLCGNFESEG